LKMMLRTNLFKVLIPFRTRIFLILFRFFVFLILLEAGLRLGGFILLSLQEHRNQLSLKRKGTCRILCLGESTTARQYPPYLEKVLNQRHTGIQFSVIDKGVVGTNSTVILSRLELNLTQYHPDMVVAMMGSNDRGILYYKDIPEAKTRLFCYCKTYRLIRLLWVRMLAKTRREDVFKKAIALNPQNADAYARLGRLYLEQAKLSQAKDLFKKAIELSPQNDRAYVGLGRVHHVRGELSQAECSFKKAIEINPQNDDAYVGLVGLYRYQGRLSQAKDLFKKAIALNPQNDRAYGALSILCEETGEPELAKEYAQKADRLRSGYDKSCTSNNYRALKDILDKKRIRLVCVQYPMRSIEPLKRIFEGDEKGIVFVDNEKLFKEAVKKDSYDVYFLDMFGGEFGHCTGKGNRLLAANIANVILKEVFNK
jgi:tetratricopeptide (TPR) repeat protein